MRKIDLLEKIKRAAKKDLKKRKDLRFLRTMAFLTRKGVLHANRNFDDFFMGKLPVKDAIWAGKHLEPRILEVLPAMALRLPKEIVVDENTPADFLAAVEALRENKADGPTFMGIEYDKYKVWMGLNLADKRTKPISEQRKMKSFRLKPETIKKLKQLKAETGLSESELIDSLV